MTGASANLSVARQPTTRPAAVGTDQWQQRVLEVPSAPGEVLVQLRVLECFGDPELVIYDGPDLAEGSVRLGRVTPAQVRAAPFDEVVARSRHWVSRADEDDSCLYFGVFSGGALVGQILLHDIGPGGREGLIAYHLFTASSRRRGIGTAALRLLQRHLADTRPVSAAVIITSHDNYASQGLAERCGFQPSGTPREDPTGVVYRWHVP